MRGSYARISSEVTASEEVMDLWMRMTSGGTM